MRGDGCEPHRLVGRNRLGGRDRWWRGCDTHPIPSGAIIAKLSHVLRFGMVNMDEPMPRLRMDVDLPDRPLHTRRRTHPYYEMMVLGQCVVVPLLRRREIPMRVQPVRIARGQQQLPGPVSLR